VAVRLPLKAAVKLLGRPLFLTPCSLASGPASFNNKISRSPLTTSAVSCYESRNLLAKINIYKKRVGGLFYPHTYADLGQAFAMDSKYLRGSSILVWQEAIYLHGRLLNLVNPTITQCHKSCQFSHGIRHYLLRISSSDGEVIEPVIQASVR